MYKVWTVEDIRQILDEVADRMGLSCSHIPVKINNRLRRLKGRCWTKKIKVNGKTKVIGTEIELAGLLVNGNYKEEDVIHTIIHEYVHFYTNVIENEYCGHDKRFKANCIKAGIVPDTYVPYEIRKEEYKYTVTCKGCGNSWGKHRLAGGVIGYKKDYHCSKCKSGLDVKQHF